jgi:hypothetical protein
MLSCLLCVGDLVDIMVIALDCVLLLCEVLCGWMSDRCGVLIAGSHTSCCQLIAHPLIHKKHTAHTIQRQSLR